MAVALKTAGGQCLAELVDHKGEVRDYVLQLSPVSPAWPWGCLMTRQDGEADTYAVGLDSLGNWSCTCPDWIYRRRKLGQDCKHLEFARELHRILQALTAVPTTAPPAGLLPRLVLNRSGG